MKNPYRILSLFLALFLSTQTALADTNGSNENVLGSSGGLMPDPSMLGGGGGLSPDPTIKEKGITASGGGGGLYPDPTTATTSQQLFCIQGFCFEI